jgi:predicted acyltransferase
MLPDFARVLAGVLTAPRINNEPMDPALRGYFRLPGTGTLIKLAGFVKTDLFVDTNLAGSY